MPNEKDTKGESPKQEPSTKDGDTEAVKESQQVEDKPEEAIPEEVEMEQPVNQGLLRDPRTGELLRDQSPGVPESPWVGQHKVGDVDSETIREPAIPKADFGE